MFPRYFWVGTATGFVVGAACAYVFSSGTGNSVIGTGVLCAAAGGVIGSCKERMFPRYSLIGTATGLVVGAVSAAMLNPGYETSDSVIGSGVLGAVAGGVIGSCTAGVILTLRWLRGRR
jgi:hypothetical protein